MNVKLYLNKSDGIYNSCKISFCLLNFIVFIFKE